MVMKKTQWKYLKNSIKKSLVSFIAVAGIAGTSVAIYLGNQSGATAILKRADRYFVENELASYEITCANGITQEDIDTISGWDGVGAVEGGYTAMVILETETERVSIQARSLLEEINKPVVLQGTLPTAENETAIEQIFAERKGIQIGDEIRITHDGELKEETFIVTGIINEPSFSCSKVMDARGRSEEGIGSAYYYMSLPSTAFDTSYYNECYAKAYIRNQDLDEYYYFSEEYKEQEAAFKNQIEELAKERANLRYETIQEEAQNALAEARTELSEAEAELLNGKADVAEAEADLEDGKKKLADSEAELADAKEAIKEQEKQLKTALAEIEAALQSLGLGTDLKQAKLELDYLGAYGAPVKASIEQYEAGVKELKNAKAQLLDGEKEVEDAKAELSEAEEELKNAKIELEDAELSLSEAKKELTEAEEDAGEIQLKDWMISIRNDIGDVRAIETSVEGIYGVSYALAFIFLLVAIIVCHAAISRMINEQRSLIGAQKALGFSSKEILRHYMLYSISCGVLGTIGGWIASVVIVQSIDLMIFKKLFLLGEISKIFLWEQAFFVAGICLVVFIAAAYMACAKAVSLPATVLLRGEVPEREKPFFFEKWKCFKKLNLYSRTMIKNVLGDKARMATTVMGVVGCTSLLVICFMLHMGIVNSSVKHFEEYFLYENRLVVDSSKGDAKDFQEILEREGVTYTRIQDKLKNFRVAGGGWENGHILAVNDKEALKEFMVLEDIKTKEIVEVPEEGILISRKCAENLDIEKGAVIEIMDSEGNPKEFQVAGIIEHYLAYNLFVCSDSYYETAMEEETDFCVFLLKGNIDGLYEKVRNIDGFMSLKDNSEYEATADSIKVVIAVCFVFAGIMSVQVLLNQIVMNINRKATELAVMRINGYTIKETEAFVARDNIVLTIIGLLLGCGMGTALGCLIVWMVEMGASRYVRTPNLAACVYSALIGGMFAFIVNKIALRKIRHLNLTNVNGN